MKNKNTIPKKLNLSWQDSGFFFGKEDRDDIDRYIGLPQEEESHILVIGGTGTGKSSSIAMPTLETWKGAIVAVDVKGELSEHYARLYEADLVERPFIVFDPADEESVCFDPFALLAKDAPDNLYENLQDIVSTIIPLTVNAKDPFWEQSEQSILNKLLEYYYRLGMGFIDALSMILCNKLEVLLGMLSKPEMQFTSMFVGGVTSMKPEALSSIEEGIRQKIEVFVYSRIAHAFRGNSRDKAVHRFDWECLNQCNVFLRIPDDKIETWGPAINLLLGQLIQYLQRRGSKYDDPDSIPTLLLMDEFARLGKLEKVKSALTMLRSRNVTVCLMVQSFPQLEDIYGLDTRKIIADNCRTKVILGANDYDTQVYLSRLIGEAKKRKANLSISLDAARSCAGYGIQLYSINEPYVRSSELATLKKVIILTRFGCSKVKKWKMRECMEWTDNGVLLPKQQIPVTHDCILGTGKSRYSNGFLRNHGAKMLSTAERLQLAKKHFEEAQAAHLGKGTRHQLSLKPDDSTLINLGRRLLIFFPDILKEVPCKTGNDQPTRFQAIESRMYALKRDPELFKLLQHKAALLDPVDSTAPLAKKERQAGRILKHVTDSYLWGLGNLLCTHFPEVCSTDPVNYGAGLTERIWPVDSILLALSEDHDILEQIANQAQRKSVDGGSAIPSRLEGRR